MRSALVWTVVAGLALGGVALTGCGGDDDGEAEQITGPDSGAEENGDSDGSVAFGMPDGTYGAILTIDGTEVSYAAASAAEAGGIAIPITGLGDQRFLSLGGGAPGTANNVQLRMLPIGQTGSYTCGEGPSDFRLVHVYLVQEFVTFRAEGDVGSCRIEVTRAGDTYEGTFQGTFVNGDGESRTASGSFRNDGSSL